MPKNVTIEKNDKDFDSEEDLLNFQQINRLFKMKKSLTKILEEYAKQK